MSQNSSKPALRWTAISLLFLFGLLLVLCSVLVPTHFRAVDAQVVEESGRASTTLVDEGIRRLNEGMIGQARLFLLAAQQCELSGTKDLQRILQEAEAWQANQKGISELDLIMRQDPLAMKWDGRPVMEILSSRSARIAIRGQLKTAYRSGVLEILKTRDLTDLHYFAPADSAAGQPYEAACLITALLAQHQELPSSLRDDLESMAYGATRKGETRLLELLYLDMVSLGTRLNWSQLVEVLKTVPSWEVLRNLANLTRHRKEQWQTLMAAALLDGSAKRVTEYLINHGETGRKDLKFALQRGQGALRKLLDRNQRVYDPAWRKNLLEYEPFYSIFITWLRVANNDHSYGLILKYGMLIIGTFFLGRAIIDLMPVAEGIAVKRWASPAHWVLFGALAVLVLALFEPFLFKHNQILNFPLHWKFPMLGEGIRQTISNTLKPMIDLLTIIALVTFLALQGTIYVICLLKLAEIRRQQVPSRIKLKLLENEENMFDSGLYVGLGGTVASLVFLAMGILKPSLMAAYASTLFGIIFVAILKIVHLRPFRRRLIIDAELWNTDE